MLHIIINPTAGNGKAERTGGDILQVLGDQGIPYTVSYTQREGHATELAQAAVAEGAETIVAVGGDGTVLEVVRGIHGTDAALGIIPAGTGNDVIKVLGTPKVPVEALDFILKNDPRPLDAGLINDKVFLNVCGTGFDVAVLDNAEPAKRFVQGMLPYLWGVIRTIFTYKPVTVKLSIDGGETVEKPVLLVAVANGRFIGGGMEVAPDARPDDGMLDVVLIDHMPRRKMPIQLPKLLMGKIKQIPGTMYKRCTSVTITSDNMRLNIDGEIEPMHEARLQVLPGDLRAHW